jgi:hypothetical protein
MPLTPDVKTDEKSKKTARFASIAIFLDKTIYFSEESILRLLILG